MKKLFFMLAFFGSAAVATAQDLGRTLLSGSTGYSTSKSESDGNFSGIDQHKFTASTRVGFFVSPAVAVGGFAGYENSITPQQFTLASYDGGIFNAVVGKELQLFTVGPFVRAYKPLGNRAALFGQLQAYYQIGKATPPGLADASSSSITMQGGGVNVAPGFVFFPSNTIGVELSLGNLGYSILTSEQKGQSEPVDNHAFDASFGFNTLAVGISLYLGRTAAE